MSSTSAFKTVFINTRDCIRDTVNQDSTPYIVVPRSDYNAEAISVSQTPAALDRQISQHFKPAEYTIVLNTISGIDVPREGVTTLKIEDVNIDECSNRFNFYELAPNNTGFIVDFSGVTKVNGQDCNFVTSIVIDGFLDSFTVRRTVDGAPADIEIPPISPVTRTVAPLEVNSGDSYNNLLIRMNLYLSGMKNRPLKYLRNDFATVPLTQDDEYGGSWEKVFQAMLSTLRFRLLQRDTSDEQEPSNTDPKAFVPYALLVGFGFLNTPKRLFTGVEAYIRFHDPQRSFRTFGKYLTNLDSNRSQVLYPQYNVENNMAYWICIGYRTNADYWLESYDQSQTGRLLRIVLDTDASSPNQDFTGRSRMDDKSLDWANTVAIISFTDSGSYTVKTMPHSLTPGSRLSSMRIRIVGDYNDVIYTPNHFKILMSLSNSSNLHNPAL